MQPMKLHQIISNRLGILTAVAILNTLLLTIPVLATDHHWSGGGGSDNMGDGGNWFDGNPSCGDNLYFDNTSGSHHYVYDDYGSCQNFNYFIQYSGAGYIGLYGPTTYLVKFENNNEGNLLEDTSTIESLSGSDLQINPVGSGGVAVNNVVLQNGKWLYVYGGNTLTVNGVISQTGGTSSLVAGANGATTVILKNANTFSGATYVNNGTLEASINGALGSSAVTLGDTSGSAGAALNLDGGLTWNGQLTTVRSGSSGTKTIANTSGTSGTATYNNNLTLNASATLFANSSGAVTLSGSTLDLQGNTLTVDGGGNSTISGTLQNSTSSGKLTKNGAGTLTVSGNNSYTGA